MPRVIRASLLLVPVLLAHPACSDGGPDVPRCRKTWVAIRHHSIDQVVEVCKLVDGGAVVDCDACVVVGG